MNYHENPFFVYDIYSRNYRNPKQLKNIRGTKHFHFRGNDNNIDILCSLNPTLKMYLCISNDFDGVSVLHTHLDTLKFIFINKNHSNNSQCHPNSTKKNQLKSRSFQPNLIFNIGFYRLINILFHRLCLFISQSFYIYIFYLLSIFVVVVVFFLLSDK